MIYEVGDRYHMTGPGPESPLRSRLPGHLPSVPLCGPKERKVAQGFHLFKYKLLCFEGMGDIEQIAICQDERSLYRWRLVVCTMSPCGLCCVVVSAAWCPCCVPG